MITNSDLLEITITEDMYNKALSSFKFIPKKSKNVFMSDVDLLNGFIGEQMFDSVFPGFFKSEGSDVYQFDRSINNKKIEIKTKGCTVFPNINFAEGSIYKYHEKQAFDYVMFIRILRGIPKPIKGWIMSYFSYSEFHKKKYLEKKGKYQQAAKFTNRTDTWNVKIKDGHSISEFNDKLLKKSEIK